jgi:hypothetical protein
MTKIVAETPFRLVAVVCGILDHLFTHGVVPKLYNNNNNGLNGSF